MLFDLIKAIVLAGIPIAAFSYYLIILTRKKVNLQSSNATQLKKELKNIELEPVEKEPFIQRVLQKKFMKFGGGFYGVLTFITYLHIEGYQLIQFISSFTTEGSGFDGGIFSLILGFFLEMIMNFFTALMWPIYWSKFLPIESFWIWLLVAIFAHTWATRYALSRKGSNIL
jgi:hypothetical protein